MRVSLIVPTYKREGSLFKLLSSLDSQEQFPTEVIVVCRKEDGQTRGRVEAWVNERSPYRRILCVVEQAGQVHALQEGLKISAGDIVIFTDDDAIPRADWISRITRYYLDPVVGGVGGRDVIDGLDNSVSNSLVGKFRWYGRIVGNHHLGCHSPCTVDVLKGVNMSYRRELVKFPGYLLGEGAQVHNEVGVCLYIRKMGYKLIYDPEIRVDHYPGKRVDSDQRNALAFSAIRDAAYNITLSVLIWAPLGHKFSRLLYSSLIGDRGFPGLARTALAVLTSEPTVVKAYLPAQAGYLKAIRAYIRYRAGLA